jgi:hypothetical protein
MRLMPPPTSNISTMDLPMPSEAALNPDSEFGKIIMAKIVRKTSQLKKDGMTLDDRKNLKERLAFTWRDAPDNKAKDVTAWRKKTARQAYADIQDASNHLFLIVILTITPTECSKPGFKEVKQSLLSLKSYEDYRVNMDFEEKHFFESIAAERSFISNYRYLNFMTTLFPQR